ncbi:hypothetical protein AAG570_009910, partial [Ranatra chinensis]
LLQQTYLFSDEERELVGERITGTETNESEEEERRENERFEEEEKRIAEEVEAEVRKLLAKQAATCETTDQSEWSDEDENAASEPLLADRESTGYTTDDPALENISMIHETGLTDAEGSFITLKKKMKFAPLQKLYTQNYEQSALSDVNSIFDGVCHDEGDNTSLSSRASSRLLDSDAVLSLDSLSALYDSEYDTCYAEDYRYYNRELAPDITNLANIRSMSESITRNFGQPRSETDSDV